MDKEEAGRILGQAIESRQAAQEVARKAHQTIDGTEMVIRGVLRMFPELETGDELEWGNPERGEPLSGADAVRAVLKEEPLQLMTVRAVFQRLEHNNWLPQSDNPLNAVRTALERAVAQGEGIEKTKNGAGAVVYQFNPRWEEEPF